MASSTDTVRFNQFGQYNAVDLTVTLLAGSDLAARLPTGWTLPGGKYKPLAEASMQHRGYMVQIVSLLNVVSEFAAVNIFPFVPAIPVVAVSVVIDVSP